MKRKASSVSSGLIALLTTGLVLFSFRQQYTEHEVKSAYIYNFCKFIDWPEFTRPDSTNLFVIGFYGGESFSNTFSQVLEGKKIKEKGWLIKEFHQIEDIDCQILIITNRPKSELEKLFKILSGKPVLTVGDNIPEFCETGGMINFTARNTSKQFEINNDAALRAKLIISSKLLALARIVTDEEDIF